MVTQELTQRTDPVSEFLSDYISTVVKYAKQMYGQEDRQLTILDLCTRGGAVTKALFEKLVANEIDFRELVVNKDPCNLYNAWEHMKDISTGTQLTYLLRDIRDINNPIDINARRIEEEAFDKFGPDSSTPNQKRFAEYLTIAGFEIAQVSPFDKETQIADGSIDMLMGSGTFSFLSQENYDEQVKKAVDETTKLLRKGGYAVFTAGFNEPEEIKARGKPFALGFRQAELDEHFQANGLVLQEGGPRKYTIVGLSPFHYAEVFAYKKE